MTKIISIATLKGGISKTLSTYMIACNLADLKYKVLCMDFDPQSNLSSHFGIDISDINLKGVHNIFDDKITYKAEDIISIFIYIIFFIIKLKNSYKQII